MSDEGLMFEVKGSKCNDPGFYSNLQVKNFQENTLESKMLTGAVTILTKLSA